jgi:EpsG family
MAEFSSLILYLSIFTISFLLISITSNEKKGSIVLVFIAISIPILLASFRYAVGTDYFNYMRAFNQARYISFTEYIDSNLIFEFGNFLVKKLAAFFNSYGVLLGIYSSLTIIFIYIALKEHKNKIPIGIGLFIFFCIYYPSSLNLMTQFVAISIVAFSLKYVFKKEFLKFSITLFIAALFHTTALIVFPIYFLWDKKKSDLANNWRITLSIIICVLIAFNYQTVLEYLSQIGNFQQYGTYAIENTRGENRDIYFKLLLLFIVILFRKPLIKYDKRNKLYILLILLALIIGMTGFTSPWVKRVALYFEVAQLFILPSIIQLFKTPKDRSVVYLGIYIYAIAYFILVYYLLGQAHVIPYNLSL